MSTTATHEAKSQTVAGKPVETRRPPLPGWRTVSSMARELGVSEKWVLRKTSLLGFEPQYFVSRTSGYVCRHYSPRCFRDLERLNVQVGTAPPGWRTQRRMATELGTDSEWVAKRVEQLGYDPVPYKAYRGVYLHYPPECFEELDSLRQQVNDCPEAGDWLTKRQLSVRVGKSHQWVSNKIQEMGIESEWRNVWCGRGFAVRICYPPQTLDLLREHSQNYQPANGWLTLDAIANLTGRTHRRVSNSLAKLGVPAEQRYPERGGRLAWYYPPTIVEQLQELWEEEEATVPPEGDWLCVPAMAELLTRSCNWVEGRIGSFAHLAQLRRPSMYGPVGLRYPPVVLTELLRISHREANMVILVKPFCGFITNIKEAQGWRWSKVEEAAGLDRSIPAIVKVKYITIKEAMQILEGMQWLLYQPSKEIAAYLHQLHERRVKAIAWPPPKLVQHEFSMCVQSNRIVAVCEPCQWASSTGFDSSKLTRAAYDKHALTKRLETAPRPYLVAVDDDPEPLLQERPETAPLPYPIAVDDDPEPVMYQWLEPDPRPLPVAVPDPAPVLAPVIHHKMVIRPEGQKVFAGCKPCDWWSSEGFETHAEVKTAFEHHTRG